LGNFISNQREVHTDGGIMASFTIAKNKKTNRVYIENSMAIPYWVYRNLSLPPSYFVLPVEPFLNDTATFSFSTEERAVFQRFVDNTNKLLFKNSVSF
jgi:cyclopropane fatty-acyl-phospholipid synthase-like methyltransferase